MYPLAYTTKAGDVEVYALPVISRLAGSLRARIAFLLTVAALLPVAFFLIDGGDADGAGCGVGDAAETMFLTIAATDAEGVLTPTLKRERPHIGSSWAAPMRSIGQEARRTA